MYLFDITRTHTHPPRTHTQVIADNASGLLFKNKRDRKIINVDPKVQAVWGVCVGCVYVCVGVLCVCGGK